MIIFINVYHFIMGFIVSCSYLQVMYFGQIHPDIQFQAAVDPSNIIKIFYTQIVQGLQILQIVTLVVLLATID